MKLASIVGARPQFIKLAPLARSLELHRKVGGEPIDHVIIHTGQHYDRAMSEIFFEELEIPRATLNLGVGSGSHGNQTGQMLDKIEQALLELSPDMVLIFGDTNSTLAGALAAAKLQIAMAHVEAGLRSFNRRMPEEINRVLADHVSDLLLAPTPTALENLAREGLSERTVFTGDIMYDAVLYNLELAARKSRILERLALEPRSYAVATVHRAENTDDEQRLGNLLQVFNDIAANSFHLVLPLHPRTAKLVRSRFPGWSPHPRLRTIEPVGHLDMLWLLTHARMTLTDSGGLQKEAFFMGCPCITLREETEWVETIQAGCNVLSGIETGKIRAAMSTYETLFPSGKADSSAAVAASFGDGHAADMIKNALLSSWRQRASQLN